MTIGMQMRLAATAAMLGGAAMTLSGCLGSPTYGTDKTATEQLLEDLGDAASIRPQQGTDIVYRPRPELVTPPSTDPLPPPQESVARSEAWPESPEETRQRLLAEADLSGGTGNFSSPLARRETQIQRSTGSVRGPVAGDDVHLSARESRESQERFRQAQQVARASDPTTRNFLSEPPIDYRQPAATAPVGDLGESERTKERRRLREAQKGSPRRQWWPF